MSLKHFPRVFLGFLFIFVVYRVKRFWWRDYIICGPERPGPSYTLWKLSMLSGIRLVAADECPERSGREPLARIWHNNETWEECEHPGYLNGRCTDISKIHVDRVFGDVFGFSTEIDPTTFRGRAVMKPDENCAGVGVLIETPVKPEDVSPDHIYQRLVDNTIGDGVVREYRVTVMLGKITDVVRQDRLEEGRLIGRGAGGTRGSKVMTADEAFSADDRSRILTFCDRLGLDFGELDILPDRTENRLYILDANKTPTTMVKGEAFRIDRMLTLMKRAETFAKLLRSQSPGQRHRTILR
ncbi:MAG: hypothetical protein R3282_05890 [Rhodothermales bacterium]|nr:hypothetical protein [Rhodothermales bacterium]